MYYINDKYLKIINPTTIVNHIEDFDAWLDLAESKEDLICTLEAFQKAEMYEYCVKIKNKIENYEKIHNNSTSN